MPTPLSLLAAAPHRTLFLPGAVQTVLAVAFWLAALLAQAGLLPLPEPRLPAAALHLWVMPYGLFPFFVFGFLFTAVPNWLETAPPAKAAYVLVAVFLASGVAIAYVAAFWPVLALPAWGLQTAGWFAALWALGRLLTAPRRTAAPPASTLTVLPALDRRHARVAWLACALGALGNLLFALWLANDTGPALRWAQALGIWGFLTPLFLAVCHRMLPWFTSRIVGGYAPYRPTWALGTLVGLAWLHAILEGLGLPQWTWVADLPLAAVTAWLAWRWHHPHVWRVRLLAMLHLALPWAALAFTLYAIDSLMSWSGAGSGLGLAPLHALGIGFFGGMLLAMAARVSLGHSGRKLEADRLTWGLFWLVQVAALARILPELLAVAQPLPWQILSATLWLAAFLPWAWRHAPFYWRPRVDGKPG